MKAVIRIGYQDYIMGAEQAMQIAKLMMSAERYMKKGWGDEATYYVWADDAPATQELTVVSDDLYTMAKLAGAPPK